MMSTSSAVGVSAPPAAAQLDRTFVIERCRSLVDFQLWPIEMESRIEPWLANFAADEADTALHLLNSFVFVSERLATQLFSPASTA